MPPRVTVIGTGYVGTTHAACLAAGGCRVLGVDTDRSRIATLASGSAPFYEPGLGKLVRRHVAGGRLRFTTSLAEAAAFGDVHFLCVGTPQSEDGFGADLRQVEAAVDGLAPYLRRQCLVVGKSTVPVGTAERLARRLARDAPAHSDVDLAWNPEFLREGTAVVDSLRPDRIVVGLRSVFAERTLRAVYAEQLRHRVPLVVTDLATAELAKLAANAFLATKVSFVNALAEMCEVTGADVTLLAEAMGSDPRIGRRYLDAGVGFGGGCLPKDVRALRAGADELGLDQAVLLLDTVDEINKGARTRAVELAEQMCGGALSGRRVCVLGAAFKAGSDDVRDSPALDVAGRVRSRGAVVRVYDPAALANAERSSPELTYARSVGQAARHADILLVLTDWQEFRDLDPAGLDGVVARRCILDCRNALDPQRWRRAGWTYRGIGRRVGAPRLVGAVATRHHARPATRRVRSSFLHAGWPVRRRAQHGTAAPWAEDLVSRPSDEATR